MRRGEAAAGLIALADFDQPGVVVRAGMAEGEEFLEHDGDFNGVRSAERAELEGMTTRPANPCRA